MLPYQDSQNFLSRDKELSEFTSNTIGFTVSYDFVQNGWHAIDRGSINFTYDHIMFEYDDFRDLRKRLQRLARSHCMFFQLTWHRRLSQHGIEKSTISYCY